MRDVTIKQAQFVAIPAGTKMYRMNTLNDDPEDDYYAVDKCVPYGTYDESLAHNRQFMFTLQGDLIWSGERTKASEYVLKQSVIAANCFYTNTDEHLSDNNLRSTAVRDHDDLIEIDFLEASRYVEKVRDIPWEEVTSLPDYQVSMDSLEYKAIIEMARMARFAKFDTFQDAHRYLWSLTGRPVPPFKVSKYDFAYGRIYGAFNDDRADKYREAFKTFQKHHGSDDEYHVGTIAMQMYERDDPRKYSMRWKLPMIGQIQ